MSGKGVSRLSKIMAALFAAQAAKTDAATVNPNPTHDSEKQTTEQYFDPNQNQPKGDSTDYSEHNKVGDEKFDQQHHQQAEQNYSNNQQETQQQQKGKVTSSETIGRTSTNRLTGNFGSLVRTLGLGYMGTGAEMLPNAWMRRAATVLAGVKVLQTIFGSSQKYGGFFDRAMSLGRNYAQGHLAGNALGGNVKLDMKTAIIALIAFGGNPQQALGQMMGGAGLGGFDMSSILGGAGGGVGKG